MSTIVYQQFAGELGAAHERARVCEEAATKERLLDAMPHRRQMVQLAQAASRASAGDPIADLVLLQAHVLLARLACRRVFTACTADGNADPPHMPLDSPEMLRATAEEASESAEVAAGILERVPAQLGGVFREAVTLASDAAAACSLLVSAVCDLYVAAELSVLESDSSVNATELFSRLKTLDVEAPMSVEAYMLRGLLQSMGLAYLSRLDDLEGAREYLNETARASPEAQQLLARHGAPSLLRRGRQAPEPDRLIAILARAGAVRDSDLTLLFGDATRVHGLVPPTITSVFTAARGSPADEEGLGPTRVLEEAPPQPVRDVVCASCGKAPDRLLKCNGCRNRSYCGRDCQLADWPEHAVPCRTIQGKAVTDAHRAKAKAAREAREALKARERARDADARGDGLERRAPELGLFNEATAAELLRTFPAEAGSELWTCHGERRKTDLPWAPALYLAAARGIRPASMDALCEVNFAIAPAGCDDDDQRAVVLMHVASKRLVLVAFVRLYRDGGDGGHAGSAVKGVYIGGTDIWRHRFARVEPEGGRSETRPYPLHDTLVALARAIDAGTAPPVAELRSGDHKPIMVKLNPNTMPPSGPSASSLTGYLDPVRMAEEMKNIYPVMLGKPPPSRRSR